MENNSVENLSYDSYEKEDYYAPAKESLTSGSTDSYVEDGVNMVSVYYPIVYDNEFKGVVIIDIEADAFSIVNAGDSDFSSLSVAVFNGNGSVLYSSDSDEIGSSYQDTVQNGYDEIAAGMAGGTKFSATDEKTEKVERYFVPVTAAGQRC